MRRTSGAVKGGRICADGVSVVPSFPALVDTVIALGLAWFALSAWVVIGRARADRLRRASARLRRESARELARFAAGTGAFGGWPRRRLRRVAGGELAPASVRATRELVGVEPGRLERRATRRSERGLLALRILARGDSPEAFALIRQARLGGRERVIAGLVAIVSELDSLEADEFLLSVLVAGDHPRSRTATELTHRVPRLRDKLLALAAHPDGAIRYWALMLLANAATEAAVVAAAVEGCGDLEAAVRGAAARVLGAAGSLEPLFALRGLLGDEVFFVRAHAVRAVGELEAGSIAHEAAALLADPNWWVRAAAKEALLALGEDGLEAAAATLHSEDRFAREAAADLVLRLRSAAPTPYEAPFELLAGVAG